MIRNRLLFVDDEPGIRATLPAILTLEGFEVTTAATVEEALKCVADRTFDVLLTDLNISQPADGFIVVGAMRRHQPKAVTMILTGYPDFETAVRAIRDHVDDYLSKPVDIKQLVTTIKQRLETPGLKPDLETKRISEFLRENADAIVERWLTAARRDPELSRALTSTIQNTEFPRAVIKELANRAPSLQSGISEETRKSAQAYGRQRRAQGCTAAQIVSETRLLYDAVSATLQDHLHSIDYNTVISELLLFGNTLHEQLEESVRAFEKEPMRRAV